MRIAVKQTKWKVFGLFSDISLPVRVKPLDQKVVTKAEKGA
jgi:hypothetical protein